MTLECVVDAELFKKYCSDGCDSIGDVTRCLLDCEADNYVILECGCLIEFLDAIATERCVMCYDEKIKKEYIIHVDNMPAELVSPLEHILSNTASTRKMERGCFKLDDFEELKSTELERKVKYLDVAKCLMNRRIVSTKEEIKSTYKPNRRILLSHDISAKNVCEQWNEIKKNVE